MQRVDETDYYLKSNELRVWIDEEKGKVRCSVVLLIVRMMSLSALNFYPSFVAAVSVLIS